MQNEPGHRQTGSTFSEPETALRRCKGWKW